MDAKHARKLLDLERTRIEQALAELDGDGPLESDARLGPGDEDDEHLDQDEFDEGHRQELMPQLAALERAEARLEAGTYGLSVESGEPIPDGRLEALPTAERTVDDERPLPRGRAR